MKKTIILEHRQALDEMEVAKSTYVTCRRKGQCDNGKNCATCPAALGFQEKKDQFELKAEELDKVNRQTIQQNEMLMTAQKEKRIEEREKRTMGRKQALIYNRDELTIERYKEHSKAGMTDREIRELYDFPTSSFNKWKRDNNLVQKYKQQKGATMTSEKTVNSNEEPAYKQQYEQVKAEYDALLENHLKLQQVLEAANAESTKRIEKMTHLEAEIDSLKEVNVGLKTERDVFEAESSHYKEQLESQAETIERLQADIATLIEDADNDTTEAIQRQFQRFDQWETMMLERLLQMKKAN